MKRTMFLTMLLLLVGVNTQAQSVSTEQMDERFNNNKLPYGWFAEGWKVDSTGVAKKGSPDKGQSETGSGTPGFNMEDLMGGGSSSMVFNFTNVGDKESLAIHNIKWRIRSFFGVRF